MLWFTFKGMLFCIPILFYNCVNGFSGDTNFDDLSYSFYTLMATLFASYIYLLAEQDVSPEDFNNKNMSAI